MEIKLNFSPKNKIKIKLNFEVYIKQKNYDLLFV